MIKVLRTRYKRAFFADKVLSKKTTGALKWTAARGHLSAWLVSNIANFCYAAACRHYAPTDIERGRLLKAQLQLGWQQWAREWSREERIVILQNCHQLPRACCTSAQVAQAIGPWRDARESISVGGNVERKGGDVTSRVGGPTHVPGLERVVGEADQAEPRVGLALACSDRSGWIKVNRIPQPYNHCDNDNYDY